MCTYGGLCLFSSLHYYAVLIQPINKKNNGFYGGFEDFFELLFFFLFNSVLFRTIKVMCLKLVLHKLNMSVCCAAAVSSDAQKRSIRNNVITVQQHIYI